MLQRHAHNLAVIRNRKNIEKKGEKTYILSHLHQRDILNPPAVERIQSYDSNTHDDGKNAYVLDDNVNEEDKRIMYVDEDE